MYYGSLLCLCYALTEGLELFRQRIPCWSCWICPQVIGTVNMDDGTDSDEVAEAKEPNG